MLGYGGMRFPQNEDKTLDMAKCEELIDKGYSAGIRYFDTAYFYCGGQSEVMFGKVLAKYPRDSYYIADKLPLWDIDSADKAEEIFNDQLSKLNVDYIDFYLFHALDEKKWRDMVLKFDLINMMLRKKEEGKIKYLGFSFHDRYQVFEEIVNHHDWDFCQIQLNYIDTDMQAGLKGYELARKKGIPLVIMEPVKGGLLAKLPARIEEIFKSVRPDKSIASWAMRYLADKSNVKVILSGMSDDSQLTDNLDTFNNYEAITDSDREALDKAAHTMKTSVKNGCTQCAYCMPCPAGVNIPKTFQTWNMYGVFGENPSSRHHWKEIAKDGGLATNCIGCGKCETLCPQGVSIISDLKRANEEMNLWV